MFLRGREASSGSMMRCDVLAIGRLVSSNRTGKQSTEQGLRGHHSASQGSKEISLLATLSWESTLDVPDNADSASDTIQDDG